VRNNNLEQVDLDRRLAATRDPDALTIPSTSTSTSTSNRDYVALPVKTATRLLVALRRLDRSTGSTTDTRGLLFDLESHLRAAAVADIGNGSRCLRPGWATVEAARGDDPDLKARTITHWATKGFVRAERFGNTWIVNVADVLERKERNRDREAARD
jgi:hypothetical protein